METFDYLSVFYSLIVGLTVARVLSGMAALITHPQGVRWYPAYVAWSVFLLVFAAWEWWLISRWRPYGTWTFQLYFFIAIRPSLIYFATHILVPDFGERAGEIDLEAHFRAAIPWVGILFATIVLLGFADTALKGADYFMNLLPRQVPISVVSITLSLTAARLRTHRMAVVPPVALFLHYFIVAPLL